MSTVACQTTINIPSDAISKLHCQQSRIWQHQGDHSEDNVKFPDISLMVPRHVKCHSYHAHTSVTVSGGARNAIVHDPKPYI